MKNKAFLLAVSLSQLWKPDHEYAAGGGLLSSRHSRGHPINLLHQKGRARDPILPLNLASTSELIGKRQP
jgi:hypothetical protein